MEEEDWPHPDDLQGVVSPRAEAMLLSVWRRMVDEGSGPELTLAEAATLLGWSVESVRRRIKSGKIRAFRDNRGRLRIITSPAAYAAGPSPGSETVERLWQELKDARRQLDAALAANRKLREELLAGEEQLEHARSEVAQLWQAMASRAAPAVEQPDDRQRWPLGVAGPVQQLSQESKRIQGKIENARSLARRRRWLWPQAG